MCKLSAEYRRCVEALCKQRLAAKAITASYTVPTGQGTLENVREFEWSPKGQGKIFFLEKSGK